MVDAVRAVPDEEWRPIRRCAGYSVSSHGRVRSEPGPTTGKGRILKARPDRGGYFTVWIGGKRRRRFGLVHLLVADAFLPPRPRGKIVSHKNGDKGNNRLTNLCHRTLTGAINSTWDATGRDEKVLKGEQHGRHVLTESQAREVLRDYPNVSAATFAKRFRVTRQAIWLLVKGQNWKHLQPLETGSRSDSP